MASVSSNQMVQQTTEYKIFEATPGISVLLLPNAPVYTCIAVSNEFILTSGMKREDVIGKGHFETFPQSPNDSNFTGETNLKKSFEYVIRHKSSHQLPIQRYDIPVGDGTFSEKYWKINNAAVLNDEGDVLYIIHSAEDVTLQAKAEKKESEYLEMKKAHNLFIQAPVIIGIVTGDDNIIELANKELLALWGRGPEVIGQPLFKVIPELEEQGFREHLENVKRTGEGYYAYEDPSTLVRNGKKEVRYLDFTYQPYYKDSADTIASGVFAVAHDVTDRVLARQKLAENEEKYHTIFESMDQGFCILE
ncbi:MAG TPA: PAS domain-containing protein, partial [Chitinophagaceae bacterium]|nr:PAS domain-containing protein [Chitinophagaceae bacterium]